MSASISGKFFPYIYNDWLFPPNATPREIEDKGSLRASLLHKIRNTSPPCYESPAPLDRERATLLLEGEESFLDIAHFLHQTQKKGWQHIALKPLRLLVRQVANLAINLIVAPVGIVVNGVNLAPVRFKLSWRTISPDEKTELTKKAFLLKESLDLDFVNFSIGFCESILLLAAMSLLLPASKVPRISKLSAKLVEIVYSIFAENLLVGAFYILLFGAFFAYYAHLFFDEPALFSYFLPHGKRDEFYLSHTLSNEFGIRAQNGKLLSFKDTDSHLFAKIYQELLNQHFDDIARLEIQLGQKIDLNKMYFIPNNNQKIYFYKEPIIEQIRSYKGFNKDAKERWINQIQENFALIEKTVYFDGIVNSIYTTFCTTFSYENDDIKKSHEAARKKYASPFYEKPQEIPEWFREFFKQPSGERSSDTRPAPAPTSNNLEDLKDASYNPSTEYTQLREDAIKRISLAEPINTRFNPNTNRERCNEMKPINLTFFGFDSMPAKAALRKVYFSFSRKVHPDRCDETHQKEAAIVFQQLHAAYEELWELL